MRISNATGEGVPDLIIAMLRRLDEMEREDGDELEHGSEPV